LERLARGARFRLVTYGKLLLVEDEHVRIAHRFGGEEKEVRADTVVFVSHNAPNADLIDALKDWDGTVIPVGDVRSPRYLQVAIREGHMAARNL